MMSDLIHDSHSGAKRRPRILIAGEFSAGKTRLLNALLGEKALPSNVTSTSLPPMWLVSGDDEPLRLGTDGEWYELTDFDALDVEKTKFCVLRSQSPILEHFDLIDTPGNSDPNIPSECWERMVEYADLVIWCSNSNQAWRQSEKSVWMEMPDRLTHHSIIVMTHADQLPDEVSRGKVMRRVRREAGQFFETFEMISALDDEDVAGLAERLVAKAESLADFTGAPAPDFEPESVLAEMFPSEEPEEEEVQEDTRAAAIIPRRVQTRSKPAEEPERPSPHLAQEEAPQPERAPLVLSSRVFDDDVSEDLDHADDTDDVFASLKSADDSPAKPMRAFFSVPSDQDDADDSAEQDAEDEVDAHKPIVEIASKMAERESVAPQRTEQRDVEGELTRILASNTMPGPTSVTTKSDGPARAAWDEITRNVDMSNLTDVLDCVNALIDRLDGEDTAEPQSRMIARRSIL